MTQFDTVEEMVLAGASTGNLFDAACEECGTVARFNASGEQRAMGETFETRCYSCNSGRFPGLGGTHLFRVVDRSPGGHPNEPANPPIYTDESE